MRFAFMSVLTIRKRGGDALAAKGLAVAISVRKGTIRHEWKKRVLLEVT
jgi:hypothetical protein